MERHIELQRRFAPLDEAKNSESIAFESYISSELSGETFGKNWDAIFSANDSVVILGEPGSGKTHELRAQASRLIDQGQCAAFIELGQMVNAEVPPLNPNDRVALTHWRDGAADAWLFLDAVDESKFVRVSDFRAALQRVAAWVGSQRERTRYVISSRISEWRFGTDEEWVENELLVSIPNRQRSSPRHPSAAGQDLEGTPQALKSHEPGKDGRKLRVLKLLPLTSDQVLHFLLPLGGDSRSFLDEIERIDALDFVGRPEDARDLYALWRERGGIGTKAQMLERSTVAKLRLKEDRSNLSPLRLREGAEHISVCLHLTRCLYILVEEGPVEGADSIPLRACLPQDWSDAERRTLIQRALFDGAAFNRVRLHHRTHQDFLTAHWFRRVMDMDCSYSELRQLVFDERADGRLVLRPFMGSVAAWLVCIAETDKKWVQMFMTDLREYAPWIFLSYGDPQGLQVAYRRELLRHIVERFRDRSHVQVDWDAATLKRFADPQLSDDLALWIGDPSISIDIRADYVMLVRHGKLDAAMQPVVAIAVDRNAPEYLRATALGCIARIGTTEQKWEVLRAALTEGEIALRLAGWIATCIYPGVATEADLFGILGRLSSAPAKYSTSSLDHFESGVIANGKAIADEHVARFLDALVDFLRDGSGVLRPAHAWAADWLYPLIVRLLRSSTLNAGEAEMIIEAIALLSVASKQELIREWRSKEEPTLNDLSLAHPAIRRGWFWRQYDRACQRGRDQVVHLHQIERYYHAIKPHTDDQQWWFEDALSQPEPRKIFALRAGLDVRLQSKTLMRRWPPFRVLLASTKCRSLSRVVWRTIASNFMFPWHWLRQQWNWHWQHRYYWGNKWRPVKEKYWYIFNKCYLLLKHRRIASGTWWNACNFVVERARQSADKKNSSKWGGLLPTDIDRPFGHRIGQAVRAGLEKHWRAHWPLLPHEKPARNETSLKTVLGLIALDVGWSAQGDAYFAHFTLEEAKRATRYALNELNGIPDWLVSVVERHPSAVQSVFNEAIHGEWISTPGDAQLGSDTLSRLAWNDSKVARLGVAATRSLLEGSVPPNLKVLTQALQVVVKHDMDMGRWLPRLARERLAERTHNEQAAWPWLTTLIQLDAGPAFDILEHWVGDLARDAAAAVAANLCASLANRRDGGPAVRNPDYLRPLFLARFIPWVYRHVRPEDDPVHEEAYTPTPRDDATHFRHHLIEILVANDAPEAEVVLHQLSGQPELAAQRDWLADAVDRRRARLADGLRLEPPDVFELRDQHERTPRSRSDLFHIALSRIRAFKDRVERNENSIRHEAVPNAWKEKDYQLWIKRYLDGASTGRYTLPAEAEIDPGKYPDLRFEHPEVDGAISVEIEVADEWSHHDLTVALQDQLVGQYLRASNANFGIYLLIHTGKKAHWNPEGQPPRDWNGLLSDLKILANQLCESRQDIERLVVVGIDVTKPEI